MAEGGPPCEQIDLSSFATRPYNKWHGPPVTKSQSCSLGCRQWNSFGKANVRRIRQTCFHLPPFGLGCVYAGGPFLAVWGCHWNTNTCSTHHIQVSSIGGKIEDWSIALSVEERCSPRSSSTREVYSNKKKNTTIVSFAKLVLSWLEIWDSEWEDIAFNPTVPKEKWEREREERKKRTK